MRQVFCYSLQYLNDSSAAFYLTAACKELFHNEHEHIYCSCFIIYTNVSSVNNMKYGRKLRGPHYKGKSPRQDITSDKDLSVQ